MTYMAWVRGDERTVADADAAVKEFDQRAQMVQPWDPSDSITAGFYEPEEIPAELARVSVTTARQAVAEYVTTGQKPTDVEWAAG